MEDKFIWTDELVLEFSNEKFWDMRTMENFKERKLAEIKKEEKRLNQEIEKTLYADT